MSKSRPQSDEFRKIKKVPSDAKHKKTETNDESYDVPFKRVPVRFAIPVFRY